MTSWIDRFYFWSGDQQDAAHQRRVAGVCAQPRAQRWRDRGNLPHGAAWRSAARWWRVLAVPGAACMYLVEHFAMRCAALCWTDMHSFCNALCNCSLPCTRCHTPYKRVMVYG